MQSTTCSNCGQPLPAGAVFCGNCGTRQNPANQNAPTQLTPPPAPGGETLRAGAPPVGADYAPTHVQPPPAPAAPSQGSPTMQDAYASQYNAAPVPPLPYSQYAGPGGPGGSGPGGVYPPASGPQGQMMGPPPVYTPGPPPVAAPGGGVQPWAQPPKKRRGRLVLGCLLALVLVVAALGGGGYLLVKALSSRGGTTTQQGSGTPGAGSTSGSTPGATSTPGSTGGGQTLNNINRTAIYAGMTVTIQSAIQTKDTPGYTNRDPDHDVILKLQVGLDNSMTTRRNDLPFVRRVVNPRGQSFDAGIAHGTPPDVIPDLVPAQTKLTGAFYFEVPKGTNIGDWKLVLGDTNETQETIPLAGNYDGSVWNETLVPIGKSVTYYGGALVGTVVKVTTGVWTPAGYQAPQGMRFILVDLMVTNNSAASAYIGDPEFTLLLPNGERHNQDTQHGYFINDDLGGHESKDEGFACFLASPTKGDFQMIFFNQDNGIAGQIDLGTL